MRVLYALVGEPGVGKSTFIKENHLDDLTISLDDLRLLYTGKDYGWDGDNKEITVGISGGANKQVFNLLDYLLEEKAKQGRTIIVDSTHLYTHAFTRYRKIKEQYGYRIFVVDMRAETQGIDFNELLARNSSDDRRAMGKNVPVETVRKFWDRAHEHAEDFFPGFTNVISNNNMLKSGMWDANKNIENSYDKIMVIGDIHGSYDVLMKAIGNDGKLDPKTHYVFVGDYLDRGTQNAETFKYFLSIMREPNVVFIRGNHELHWDKFINGQPVPARETAKVTIPQLMQSGVTVSQIHSFARHLQDIYIANFNGKNYVITHAGLPYQLINGRYGETTRGYGVFDTFGLPEEVFTKGIGHFSMDVDADYTEGCQNQLNGKCMPVQIHGHRNEFNAVDSPYIYNLENKVERGGYLGVVIIDMDGVHRANVKNKNFRFELAEGNLDIDLTTLSNAQIMATLDHSRTINNVTIGPNLIAHNFTDDAFENNSFNSFSITARGLFTDNFGNVKGRGFSKFFNYQQVEATTDAELKKHPYPAVATKKYDGFLTLIFVLNGEQLMVESKGGGTGYSRFAKKQLLCLAGEALKKTPNLAEKDIVSWFNNHAQGKTIVMETISTKDNHIVRYDHDFNVVLSAIDNDYSMTEHADVADAFAKYVGLKRPEAFKINSWDDIQELIDFENTSDEAYSSEINTEGLVIQFADGFRFKLKNKWYLENKDLILKLDHIRKDPEYMRELRNDPEFLFYSRFADVNATVNDFLNSMNDGQLAMLPQNANKIVGKVVDAGHVDTVELRKTNPELFHGELYEDTKIS